MGYSSDDDMVRVDFFRSTGKWYTTEGVKWTGEYSLGKNKQLIHAAFAQSLRDHFKDRPDRLSSMNAICLEPYHEASHPIMIKNGAWL